jgi:Ca-activated chloride channel family protein
MKVDLNDPKLTAYALGELTGAEQASVEAVLATSPEARHEVERVREIAAMLTQELRKEPLGALSQLQRIAIASETDRLHRQQRRGAPWTGLAVAASLLIVATAYFLFPKQPVLPVAQNGQGESGAPAKVSPPAVAAGNSGRNANRPVASRPAPEKKVDEPADEPDKGMTQDRPLADAGISSDGTALVEPEPEPAPV